MNPEYFREFKRRTGQDIFKLAWANLEPNQIEAATKAFNPLRMVEEDNNVAIGLLRLMQMPEYLFYASKVLLNINLFPFQALILEELWKRPYPMLIGSRGLSKTFLLAVYILLKLRLVPGTKIVACGTSFRQSRLIWEYCIQIANKADILRSTFRTGDGAKRDIDRCTFTINDSVAYFLPVGNGGTIRGLRAHTNITDEFNDMNPEIYETVISGFGSTPKDPVANAKLSAERDARIRAGMWSADDEDNFSLSNNQSIITGTCGYDFQHFARYFRTYRNIIMSGGDLNKIPEEDRHRLKDLDWRDYSIIRLPVDLLPKNFMDEKTINRNRASMLSDAFLREYSTIFVKDSEGFFKKTLLESCIASERNGIKINNKEIVFTSRMSGDPACKYIMGVDPASEKDNLSIILLELHDDHTRIVYCWTINRKKFEARVAAGVISEHDYFQFCVTKIRDLCKAFNVVHISMDAQGGGITIQQALTSPRNGEDPIYEIIEDGKEKASDRLPGRHILELVQFSNVKKISEANHGMLFDFQSKLLLFPDYDPVELELSYQEDYRRAKEAGLTDLDNMAMYDTFEDCVLNIEALKDELVSIIRVFTTTGVERWDTPDTAQGGKKGRGKKDRYSSLLIANMAARTTGRIFVEPPKYSIMGVKVGQPKLSNKGGSLYTGRINHTFPSGRVNK